MHDRMQGELFLDIGITYTPRHDFPVVGLWKLDCAEASYGAGGYTRGSMHTINTMGRYGGLQAEMASERMERTHINFRQSYNLTWEAVRRTDNSRDMFVPKDIFTLEPSYLEHRERILKIYGKKAQKKSYGVRDEFRIGGAAVAHVAKDLDAQVSMFNVSTLLINVSKQVRAMIASKPMIWLRSETWFELLHLRLMRLTELHDKLYQRQEPPPNYAILTGLFAFLMQSVLFTPPEVDAYVRESLNLLRFRENVERFGMFFLHDLDMTKNNCLPEILKVDDADVYRSLKISFHRRKRVGLRDVTNEPQFEVDANQYPLGPTPSWKQLANALEKEPWTIIKRWEYPEELDDLVGQDSDPISIAILLFQAFTSQIWALLHPSWKSLTAEMDVFQPRDLREALEFWTLDQLHRRLISYVTHACNAGLRGDILGQRMQPFGERWRLYFEPDASTATGQRWDILRESYGLIGRYQAALKTLSTSDCDDLHNTLETIFSHCQCLPKTSKKGIWAIEDEQVILLANPRYYKLNAIKSGRSGRRKPTHASKSLLQNHLIQLAGYTRNMATRAMGAKKMLQKAVESEKKKKRSAKARNRRAPPIKKKMIMVPCDTDDEQEQEPGSETGDSLED